MSRLGKKNSLGLSKARIINLNLVVVLTKIVTRINPGKSLSRKDPVVSVPQRNPEVPTSLANHFVGRPQDSENYVRLIKRIKEIFDSPLAYQRLLSSRECSIQKLLDIFQWVLDIDHDLLLGLKPKLTEAMRTLEANSGLYPTCYELNSHLTTSSDLPETTRSSTDIYKADFKGQIVCIKTARFRVHSESEHFLKVVLKEAIFWGQLRHHNILPFYGVYRYNDMVSFVTPWMVNGNIQSFLEYNKNSNRCSFVLDVAHGLQFLHTKHIVHGDLKGPNVLVDSSGRACLADFGLASVSDPEVLSWASLSSYSSKGGSVRWQAPELFNPNVDEGMYHTTKASDIYAFGSVAYEIYAGQVPFADLARDTTVMNTILKGQRPTQPPNPSPSWSVWGLTEGIWAQIEACWDADPMKRPTVDAVIKQLGHLPLPENIKNGICDELLSPARVREMIRDAVDEHEIPMEMLDSLLAPAGVRSV